ncbi:unnamed protein product [Acidithrix sp. C25]|nr:unnamed protein product [Acidithrix sp. C25]
MVSRPGEIWTLDITRLSGPARGIYFYAHVIIELRSRKISSLGNIGI